MYSIALTDGKIINIKANEVEWCERTRTIKLIYDRQIVARINMDNIVGWIDTAYKEDVEPSTKEEYTTMVMSSGKWKCSRCEQLHSNTKSTKPMYCSSCGRKVKEYIK